MKKDIGEGRAQNILGSNGKKKPGRFDGNVGEALRLQKSQKQRRQITGSLVCQKPRCFFTVLYLKGSPVFPFSEQHVL